MQDKLLKLFWENRLWINGLWAMVLTSIALTFGDAKNNVANVAMQVFFVIGACMVVFSPLHSRTNASKAASFVVSALSASVLLYKIFS